MIHILTSTDRARAYLARIPGAVSGSGGHGRTFNVACALVNGFALSNPEAYALLSEYSQSCSPPWSERELQHKIESAANSSHQKPRGHLLGTIAATITQRNWASINRTLRRDATAVTESHLKGFRCTDSDLWDASPIKPPNDWRLGGAWIMPILYSDGELINIVTEFRTSETQQGKQKANPIGTGTTLSRNEWTNRLSKQQPDATGGAWIRMNPLDGRGISDANVMKFRFALIECDGVPLELQLPLLARLPLPTAAIIASGGRSYHSWVRVDCSTQDEYKTIVSRLLALLEKFGVDQANKNSSRLSRLPGVTRKIGASGDGQQRLLYLNPAPTQKPVL